VNSWRVFLTMAVVVALLVPAAAQGRAKSDQVFLINGDRMTGEIKQVSHGVLGLSTDDMGTLSIEWEDVDSLHSVFGFRVEDQLGGLRFGSIMLSRAGMLYVSSGGATDSVGQTFVVALVPVEASFWQQLDGSISLGVSYTKSNSLLQVDVRRRTTRNSWEFDLSSINTAQDEIEDKRRVDMTLTFRRLFRGRLFTTATFASQVNDELGLDLRLLTGGGLGLNLIRTNRNVLITTAGLSVNREWSNDSEDGLNLEAFAAVEHMVFRYDSPKMNLSTDVIVFPSISDWGRFRTEIDLSASREVVKDFTAGVSFYFSYDSEPRDPGAVNNDNGVVASVGWTF
jgi:hypothetical protein